MKRVLILHFDGNKKHLDAVYWLREYLKEKCCCDPVTMLKDYDRVRTSLNAWLSQEMEKADKILILFSEEAQEYRRFMQRKRKHTAIPKFWQAYKWYEADDSKNSTEKYLMAYFDYSRSACENAFP